MNTAKAKEAYSTLLNAMLFQGSLLLFVLTYWGAP
jgi:hypothetical protein